MRSPHVLDKKDLCCGGADDDGLFVDLSFQRQHGVDVCGCLVKISPWLVLSWRRKRPRRRRLKTQCRSKDKNKMGGPPPLRCLFNFFLRPKTALRSDRPNLEVVTPKLCLVTRRKAARLLTTTPASPTWSWAWLPYLCCDYCTAPSQRLFPIASSPILTVASLRAPTPPLLLPPPFPL